MAVAQLPINGGLPTMTRQQGNCCHARQQQRNSAAPQGLDLLSINRCEAQPVAGSLRLFIAALDPIVGLLNFIPRSESFMSFAARKMAEG